MALTGRKRDGSQEAKRAKARLKKEFEEFLQSGTHILSSERSEALLEKLHDKIRSRDRVSSGKTRMIIMRSAKWMAAAMILLVAGAAWRHYHAGYKTAPVLSSIEVKENPVIVQSNTGDSIRSILLPDNSVIKLSRGSSISYSPSFDTGRRDVRLSGKAIFEVSKNVARPFTVFAGDISTTVLGTRFLMNTLQKNRVSVKLFEGKVVIRSAAGTFGMKDVYLKPGEQFVMDSRSKQFSVRSFIENTGTPVNKAVISDTTSSTLEFNQEPLEKVLASIGKQYNIQFKFSDSHFNNMLVTGKLLPSDSLDVVLSMLGNINGLSFKKVDNNKIEVTRIQ